MVKHNQTTTYTPQHWGIRGASWGCTLAALAAYPRPWSSLWFIPSAAYRSFILQLRNSSSLCAPLAEVKISCCTRRSSGRVVPRAPSIHTTACCWLTLDTLAKLPQETCFVPGNRSPNPQYQLILHRIWRHIKPNKLTYQIKLCPVLRKFNKAFL